jgi:inhibitor of cysteine peptidase
MNVVCVFAIGALWIPLADAQARKMVHADDSSNGRQVELHVGETLEISLSENASTGFRWNTPVELPHKLEKILRPGETAVEGSGTPIGKPGVRHFYFEAIGPGMVELELYYSRPWETGKKPARKYKLRVLVRHAQER